MNSAWIDNQNGEIYLTVTNNVNLPGGVGASANTVFVCTPATLGESTACSYREYFNGANVGFDVGIDGIHFAR